jgi:hypothetical protein
MMASPLTPFLELAEAQVRWYALADSAQHAALPAALATPGMQVRCLFNAEQGTPLAAKAPHLVELTPPQSGGAPWEWIRVHAHQAPCVTVLASTLPFDALFGALQGCAEIVLPDGTGMFFAFWDPAILGTLVGQPDDLTLHVPGPVLTPAQRHALTGAVQAWWYWDRDGIVHRVHSVPVPVPGPAAEVPFALTQDQVDALVEASMPDHVLYFVDLNQQHLLMPFAPREQYAVVRDAYRQARAVGLVNMQDLVNFACVKLIYGERFDTDPVIIALLERVKNGEIAFRCALNEMP